MLNLVGTPYLLEPIAEKEAIKDIKQLEGRVTLLRQRCIMTEETVKSYYGKKKFEQVAESNAIEGNTLSVGETEVAVLKGITITGHNPTYIRDAISLERALVRLAEMAREIKRPTDIEQLHEIHGLIMGDCPGGGIFRRERVRIKGAKHVPPKTWKEVMEAMEDWQEWSVKNSELPAIVRSTILHAWLVHIHPFIDGNGRAARAITNLELVRAGYPPIIIRKKERDRYIDALGESDEGGDIRSFLELILERADGALSGLELSAKNNQGYNPHIEKIKMRQEQNLKIWETSVALLVKTIEHYLSESLDKVGGEVYIKEFESPIDLDDYISLSQGRSITKSWAFIVNVSIPGMEKIERLAYIGYRQPQMYHHMNDRGGPVIYWSIKNPNGYPKWISNSDLSPYCTEMTTSEGEGDRWSLRLKTGKIIEHRTTDLAKQISQSLVKMAADGK